MHHAKKLILVVASLAPLVSGAAVSCLFDGELPSGHLVPSVVERIQYLRRQMKEVASIKSTRTRGQILKAMPEFPYIQSADEGMEFLCETEFLAYVEKDIFRATPIPFNPLLLAEIAAIGKVNDVRATMATKSQLLLKLFNTPESAFGKYETESESSMPTVIPQPRAVRVAVAAALAKSNLVLNDEPYRKFLKDTVASLTDYELRREFHPSMERWINYAWGWHKEEAPAAKAVLLAWITEARGLLQTHVTSVYPWDTVLNTLRVLGDYGKRLGVDAEASAFIDEIIDADGVLPMVETVHEGQTSLLVEARTAKLKLER